MSDVQMVVVCAYRGFFSDDVYGECAECGTRICWRPHAPEPSRKVCLPCASQAMAQDPTAVVAATPTALEEARNYFTKRRH